jgi:hypothetical protein
LRPAPGRAPPDVILIVFDCFSKHRVFSGSAGSAQSICPLAFDQGLVPESRS